MNKFIEISSEKFDQSPFRIIGHDWMLVTAKKADKVNTMTASWGGLGVMWAKNVSFIVIRPQRFTKEFIDSSEQFSLSFLDGSFKKQLGYLGAVSGRDEDKIGKTELIVSYDNGVPYFDEAKTVIICKKLYAQEYKPECFIDTELDSKFYPDSDHHTLYISEIQKILVRE
ncbi:flavin reductase family protein [Ruminiclostridium cellobioparum]|uniref:Flavin reductase-like protein n=1 Tax=Ruminiclostridium cellobioparum subsp. termitidis CT1112 TaxID=1195236 RepID=S0FRW3_RUMCE|nr:flavin reductase family protein [Ruminiclostridium cellobioparum]EMS71904.1 flavin reductase-like protein [Ruminiclostridium cellobioparum subsp. termitidis CT1112]